MRLRALGWLWVSSWLLLGLGAEARADGGELTLPDGARIVAFAEAADDARLDVYLDLPQAFVEGRGFDERWMQALIFGLWGELAIEGADADYDAILPWAVDPDAPELGLRPLPALLPPVTPPPPKPRERKPARGKARQGAALVASSAPGKSQGALSGKVVYVSAGHGFTWTDTLGRWATQRGNTHGIVEDLVSAETINHYLVRYLTNAGATVFTAREHDMNPHMVIVDADAGGHATVEGQGTYAEHGAGWSDSVQFGFRAGLAPYLGAVNPFTQGHNRVVQAVSGAPTAWAVWTPAIPEDGHYHVYASWSQDVSRVTDAHYEIRHAGGATTVRVDQERHGRTWVDLGRYYFRAGQDEARGAVALYNDSGEEPGDVVSADAIRFGGGVGDFARGATSGDVEVSQRPRWEEAARYNIQFQGAPTSVYAYAGNDRSDDVGARSRYAAWQNEPGEDAVYVSWHTNAPSPARGTVTYVYGPNPPDGTYQFSGVAGSDDLAHAVHDELIATFRDRWEPGWRDRGVKSAYFGEVNPGHNPEMPAALVEVAFHDTAEDAAYLREPRFRRDAARAFYRGIVKYFAQRDGVAPELLPEPPERVRVTATGESTAQVAWEPPASGPTPSRFRVYQSADGRGWDDGAMVVGATRYDATGLEPGTPAYFRVTSVSAGGESFSTPTVAVSTACAGEPVSALIVYGFYRLDSASLPREALGAYGLGTVVRGLQDRVNRFDYVIEHARALAAAGVPFDAAEATAVGASGVALDAYRSVFWVLGEESTADQTFASSEQAEVTAWLASGGRRLLFASGAEIAWDLEARGTAADAAFLHATFGAAYVADRAETSGVAGVGPASGVAPLQIDDGTLGTYDVYYPDVLEPLADADELLRYDAGEGTAGVWFAGPEHDAVLLGAPLEALYPVEARDALVASLAAHAELPVLPAEGCPQIEPPDGGGADAGGGDAMGPSDTSGSTGDAGGAATSGAEVLGVSRQTSSSTRSLDGGCGAAPGPGVPWWAAASLLAWAVTRRSRVRIRG